MAYGTSTRGNRRPLYAGDDIVVNSITLDNTSDSGADVPGIRSAKRHIISTTAARTLLANESGALCLWPAAAGFTYTLPIITAANIGMWFEFLCTVTNTSVACKVITGQATDLMVGNVMSGVEATTPAAGPGPKYFPFLTDKIACTMGGSDTTAGGVAGTRIRLEAVALLKWSIVGNIICAGATIVTPAATS